jgi:hypothetical protein
MSSTLPGFNEPQGTESYHPRSLVGHSLVDLLKTTKCTGVSSEDVLLQGYRGTSLIHAIVDRKSGVATYAMEGPLYSRGSSRAMTSLPHDHDHVLEEPESLRLTVRRHHEILSTIVPTFEPFLTLDEQLTSWAVTRTSSVTKPNRPRE